MDDGTIAMDETSRWFIKFIKWFLLLNSLKFQGNSFLLVPGVKLRFQVGFNLPKPKKTYLCMAKYLSILLIFNSWRFFVNYEKVLNEGFVIFSESFSNWNYTMGNETQFILSNLHARKLLVCKLEKKPKME